MAGSGTRDPAGPRYVRMSYLGLNTPLVGRRKRKRKREKRRRRRRGRERRKEKRR